MKKPFKIISDIIFTTGLAAAGIFLIAHITGHQPFRVFIVSSGSMTPSVPVGSLVITSPRETYHFADIVTFYNSSTKKETTTHRIVGFTDDHRIRTMGDANNASDPGLVPADRIIGQVRLSVPYIGYLANFAKTPRGFILLIIIPATVIVYEELKGIIWEIKNALAKLITKKQSKQSTDTPIPDTNQCHPEQSYLYSPVNNSAAEEPPPELSPPSPNRAFDPRPAIILPIFFGALITFSLSVALFIDRETSADNTLIAAAPTPTPTPIPEPELLLPLLNEFLPNGTVPTTETDEFIEIYNPNSSPLDLTGWKLDDIADGTNVYALPPGTIIPANGFLSFIREITGIGLNNGGDTVRLLNPADTVIDSHTYSADPGEGVSIGRQPDGGAWQTCTTPSPGTSNNSDC